MTSKLAMRAGIGLAATAGFATALFSTPVQAQIAVQSGTMSGDAAFFIPRTGAAGNVGLFDITVNSLILNTTNGTTNTAVLTPTSVSFTNRANNGFPSPGDTGSLQGRLTGVAFNANGGVVPYFGVPTALSFTLNNFNTGGGLFGTLIVPTPGSNNPQIFLPIESFTLFGPAASIYTPVLGALTVGAFDASVTGGVINLPSQYKFTPLSGVLLPRVNIGLPTTFTVSGFGTITDTQSASPSQRILQSNFSPATGEVALQSDNAIYTFTIQVGNNAPITGTSRDLSPGVRFSASGSGTFSQTGTLSTTPGTLTTFNISGRGVGIATSVPGSTFAYLGPDTPNSSTTTSFSFNQPTGSLQGTINGFGGVRLGVLNPTSPVILSATSQRTVSYGDPNSFPSNFSGGPPVNPPSTGDTPGSSGGGVRNSSVTTIRAFTIASIYSSSVVYQFASTTSTTMVTQVTVQRSDDQETQFVGRNSSGQTLVVYEQVGPGSRVFPGMVGLRPIGGAPAANSTPTPSPGSSNPGSSSGSPSPGTPSPGTPSPGTPSPGTPSPGTPSPGTPSPGTPSPGAPSESNPSNPSNPSAPRPDRAL